MLIDLQPSDVSKPLGEFQHTRLNEKELLKLVKDLNSAAGESARTDTEIAKTFKLCWPELRAKLESLPSDGSTKRPERQPQEMLEELLDLARRTRPDMEETRVRMEEQFTRLSDTIQIELARTRDADQRWVELRNAFDKLKHEKDRETQKLVMMVKRAEEAKAEAIARLAATSEAVLKTAHSQTAPPNKS